MVHVTPLVLKKFAPGRCTEVRRESKGAMLMLIMYGSACHLRYFLGYSFNVYPQQSSLAPVEGTHPFYSAGCVPAGATSRSPLLACGHLYPSSFYPRESRKGCQLLQCGAPEVFFILQGFGLHAPRHCHSPLSLMFARIHPCSGIRRGSTIQIS